MPNRFKNFFLRKRKIFRIAFFIAADLVSVSLAVFLAFLVRFEGKIPPQYFSHIKAIIILTPVFYLPVFYFFRLYSFSWAYVSLQELVSLSKASFVSFLALILAFFLLREQEIFSGFPRSTLFISFVFIFIFSGAVRFLKRIYLQFLGRKKENQERVLIVGAGNSGEQILRSILNFKNGGYLPVAFVDDDPAKLGILIHGVKVAGRIKDIPRVVKEEAAESLIIALSQGGSAAVRQAVELGRQAKLKKIRIIPAFGEIINREVSLNNLREVEMEDLLSREPVSLDKKSLEDFIQGKRILITGASGSIGSELCRQVAKFVPSRIVLVDQDETGIFNISNELKNKFPNLAFNSLIGDILDQERMKSVFQEFQPEIVFHAAAYKHVPLMEENPSEAVKNNILGTKSLVEIALAVKADKFIFISTDKAVNPSSVMGATKRAGEILGLAANQKNGTKFISVRFGNVLNSRGSVIPIFREQIKKGGPVEVTDPEMKRYFMTTAEACLLVMQAGSMGQGGEVFVLDMGKPLKILDLAKEMIRFSGFEPDKDIPIVFTGKRPGEKLFEEILTAEEGMVATQNQKIFQAKLSQVDYVKFAAKIDELAEIIKTGEKEAIIKILKEIVPFYV